MNLVLLIGNLALKCTFLGQNKGHLISKGLFDVIVLTKKQMKFV